MMVVCSASGRSVKRLSTDCGRHQRREVRETNTERGICIVTEARTRGQHVSSPWTCSNLYRQSFKCGASHAIDAYL
jgi:hypothetical protein